MTIATAFARLFCRPDGQRVLAHLKHITQERVLAPDAQNAELWFLEGQRALVALIIALINQGQQEGDIK